MKIGINNYKKTNSAFTLVELSIVIVIISVLVAGIMSGQKLVQNSKLQNVIKEIKEYDIAINAFKDKFKYYPGDFPNAATYLGATNGNGNWKIDEDFQAWYHLSLAKFIPGTYTGAIAGTRYTIGVNVPASALKNGGYAISDGSVMYGTAGNYIEFGSLQGNVAGYLNGQILAANDAYFIDTKIDDGQASTGNLYGTRSSAYHNLSNCVSANYLSTSATYLLNDTTVACRMWWWLDRNK